ncbi:MAG TPA: SMI1/KNR4 family protein [Myxococcaceae bacterium]
MEELLLRTVPGLAQEWKGATPEEIAQLEQIAGRPLPSFYRWFLSRMGQSMGALAYPRHDLSAQGVLTCYAEEIAHPHPRFLLIGCDSDELLPLHLFYDLDLPAREDAGVARRHSMGGELHYQFESLREMLAWSAFFRFRVGGLPQRCKGIFLGKHPILSRLDPLMKSLGFTTPIATGAFCGLYERLDAAMHCNSTPAEESILSFTIGGSNSGTLRRILGEIATESSVEAKVKEWSPALP